MALVSVGIITSGWTGGLQDTELSKQQLQWFWSDVLSPLPCPTLSSQFLGLLLGGRPRAFTANSISQARSIPRGRRDAGPSDGPFRNANPWAGQRGKTTQCE